MILTCWHVYFQNVHVYFPVNLFTFLVLPVVKPQKILRNNKHNSGCMQPAWVFYMKCLSWSNWQPRLTFVCPSVLQFQHIFICIWDIWGPFVSSKRPQKFWPPKQQKLQILLLSHETPVTLLIKCMVWTPWQKKRPTLRTAGVDASLVSSQFSFQGCFKFPILDEAKKKSVVLRSFSEVGNIAGTHRIHVWYIYLHLLYVAIKNNQM